jgi:hypothetical protein
VMNVSTLFTSVLGLSLVRWAGSAGRHYIIST